MITRRGDINWDWHARHSQINSSIPWPKGLAEFVDNSLDNDATRVEIAITEGAVEIKDNGPGCKDFLSMFKYGKHVPSVTTELGRYGVGGKASAMMLAKKYDVVSVFGGIKSSGSVIWEEENDPENWKWDEDATQEPSGVTIKLSHLKSRAMPEPIKKGLGFIFAPAIWSGREIFITSPGRKCEIIAGWQMPKLRSDTVIHDSFTNGRGYNLTAGITDEPTEPGKGPFVIAYKHRIICVTSEPCREFAGTQKFFGFVELVGNWRLEKHKNALVDEIESEWLWDSLNRSTIHLLQQVEDEGEIIELDLIAAAIAGCLNLKVGKPRRPNRTEESMSKKPVGSERKVLEAETVTPHLGDAIERKNKNARGFQIRLESLSPEKIGRVDSNSKRVIVFLNKENAVYKQAREDKSKHLLMSIIAALLSAEHTVSKRDRNQSLINFESDQTRREFDQAYEQLMNSFCKEDLVTDE